MNNAGTGHAANCELNYTPQAADGSVPIAKALAINAAFELSLQYWSALVKRGVLTDPAAFIRPVPHLSFVWGEAAVAYLQRRHRALAATPQFAEMAWSSDPEQLRAWMPLVMEGRPLDQPMAATRVARGTDINFGALTRALLDGVDVRLGHVVRQLERGGAGWRVEAFARGREALISFSRLGKTSRMACMASMQAGPPQ